ncbi:hypothetical protein [Aquiflexum lacus]|uniref:hypothetical protein n=1 Tax=Aquiflexum lacus TaxID=2483805 RepID=UPI001893AC6A|nr:hypothetical protein [Aquiflexum lacus]
MASIKINPNTPIIRDRNTTVIILSFWLMRRIVGILGLSIVILLPLVSLLFKQCYTVQESISHYYYTISGDVFVGLVCAVAFFLILYPGEGRLEDIWTNIAGLCALGVAFFPTSYHQQNTTCTEFSFIYPEWVSTIHLLSAGAFFIILGGVAFFQFPRITAPNENKNKRKSRNRFYRVCGIIMWLCILTLIPMTFLDNYSDFLSKHKIVFIVEVVALVAFGMCWLIKGVVLELKITK